MRAVRLLCLAGFTALAAVPAHGVLLAYESFASLGELQGQSGGNGFTGVWSANTSLTQVADPGTPLVYAAPGILLDGGGGALQITGNSSNAVFRGLPAVSDAEVWVAFLLRYSGALADNHFLVLWHDTAATGDHTARPNIGLKANRGDGSGSEDLMARIQLTGNAAAYSTDLAPDTTALVLGRLSKSGGVGATYDTFDLWVDPAGIGLGAPDATVTGAGVVSSFSQVGVRVANIDAGLDTFWLDELRYGTTAADVLIATPESGSGALLALGLALLAVRARRR
jgi:hypothetical protein